MNTKVYSFALGFKKSIVQMAVFGLGAVATVLALSAPELNNLALADLVDKGLVTVGEYLKMIVGTMTVGGVIALVMNFLKVKYS